jgi:hypothetical protein
MALVALCALGACGGDDDNGTPRDAAIDSVEPDATPGPNLTEVALIPATPSQDVDILFVIDDSPSMLDKQTNLKTAFPYFLDAFSAGLPNVHIGVITTDMGTKGADDASAGPGIGSGPGSCASTGKDGALQTFSSSLVTGKFIIDENGTKNYTGDISDAFASIASAGAQGCGFEQPLGAIKRSFDNVANNGFIRAAARLAIIVLSDEDDCSMAHSTLISSDTATFGPLQSFRCTRFGVTCDVNGKSSDEMNVVGTKAVCHSNESATYMADLGRYKALLGGLKPDPRNVLFGAIVSSASSMEVELRTPPGGGNAINALAHSCSYIGASGQPEVADPAIRLVQLANEVPRGAVVSVCNQNLQPALLEMGQQINVMLGVPCIGQAIAQPAQCEVVDVLQGGAEQPIPACTDTSGSPCFTLVTDTAVCPAAQNLRVQISRPFPAASDTYTSVRCIL